MIIVKKDTTPIADECILLGRQCENEARQIEFDLSWLIDEYGSGTAVLVHKRNKDVAPYICTTTQSDNILTWTLDNQDTVYDGWGQAELRWTVGDVLAKTLIYKTMVIRSITADTTIPEPLESWYDEMIDYIDEHGIDPEDLAAAIAAYLEEHPVEAPVQSVNNKTGAVVLTASDVGALPDSTTIPTKVSQLQNDSGFGTYSKPSGGIPKTDLASAVQTSLGKADSALQTAPVTSVNNKTGAVTLTASDVGAGTYSKPSGGIPSTDMSSAVQSSLGKADTALQSAPVSSVNSKTGAVTLAAGDIGYDDSATYASGSIGAEITSLMGDLSDKLDAPSVAGTSGQVLATDGDGGTYWTNSGGGGSSPSPYTSNPSSLGTASPGSSDAYARGDHVHPKPTAADLGITVPSASSATPQALGTAAAGSSSDYSRADHVHAKPTASDIGAEASTNKVTSLSSFSTDTQYPSAKCVYDLIGDVETLLAAI